MNIGIINNKLILSLIMGGFIGALSGYIGSLMLTKRMSLMGGALGHLALPGISLALIYGFDVSLGALIFLIGGITIIWALQWYTQLATEALTAVVFASAVGVSFLYLPHKDYEIALIGSLEHLNLFNVIIACLLCSALIGLIYYFYPTLVLASISPDLVTLTHGNVQLFNLIYLVSIAITIALGVRIVGGLMTAALVAIPAATAKNSTHSLKHYQCASLLYGSLACVIGIFFAHAWNLAPGPLIIIASALLFTSSLAWINK
jgi:ABC-type Mn2+/Zn2+ transport system permease subunit